jgi:co-chaperonin GroES (HSP10)
MKAAFAPHKVEKNQLKPLNESIIVTDMNFSERLSRGGIYIPNDNGTGSGIRPRWGRVYAIGKNQKYVKVGQWILVAHGRWTRGLDVEDEEGKKTLRRIDPKDIMMISDSEEKPSDDIISQAINVLKKSND